MTLSSTNQSVCISMITGAIMLTINISQDYEAEAANFNSWDTY